MSVAIDLRHFSSILESDRDFSRGELLAAETRYAAVARGKTSLLGAAIALGRLVNTYRRLEDYPKLRRTARRLKSRAAELADPEMAMYLETTADLALVWYDYAYDRRYDLAWDKICRLRARCSRFSVLHIDWRNLFALVLRRRALAEKGANARRWAAASISELRVALTDAILLGNAYQIQQCASNLANILSVLGAPDRRLGVDVIEAAMDPVRLLELSNFVCAHFGIGRDDIYNTIFLMGHARRHHLSAHDVRSLIDTGTGLARFGDQEYRREGRVVEVAAEQRAFLAIEICHAAMRESDDALFEVYAPIVADAAWDLHANAAPAYRNAMGEIIVQGGARGSRSPALLEALRTLEQALG